MICINLWGFSIDPPYFGYNSAGQENLILRILTFQRLSEVHILSLQAIQEKILDFSGAQLLQIHSQVIVP
jgi:hypothetical protein